MSLVAVAVGAAERMPLPDSVMRAAIAALVGRTARRLRTAPADAERAFADTMRSHPIALFPSDANAQHYEVPAGLFQRMLGPRLKYSCCLYPKPGTTLAEAEEIASRVVLLSRGKVALEGTVPEVRARAGSTRVTFRAERIPPLAGIASIESHLDRHVVFVADADVFVAALVRSRVPFSDLHVTPVSLEDAFVTLTQDERR